MLKVAIMPRNHKPPLGDRSATNIQSSRDFLNLLFGDCAGPINVCTLRNSSGAGPQLTSDDPEELSEFIVKHDRPGWGTYVCVSTMIDAKHHHSKEAINEIPALHVDIDLKDIADSKDEVVRKLKTLLRYPPSFIVDSGHGCHAYWRFKEAITDVTAVDPITEIKMINRIEKALKLLCDLVGGDIKPTQPSAVMRMPGSFNTKIEDKPHEVSIVWTNNADGKTDLVTYELSDLEEMLSIASPIILRKERPAPKTVKEVDENYYERLSQEQSRKPLVDIEDRLDKMMYMGPLETSIHKTQVSVSAAMIEQGFSNEDIVTLLMDATFTAAGEYGKHWNKKREARNLEYMCESWRKKRAKDDDEPKSRSKEAPDHRDRPQSTSGPASPGEIKEKIKEKKRPFYISVAEHFFSKLELLGYDLRIFVDSKGSEHLWRYEDGLWS